MKTSNKVAKVIELRAQGKSMEEIGQEIGATRQTVSAYLRSPEATAIANELQESLLSTLQGALQCVNKAISMGDTRTAREIAVNLGRMVLAQAPIATKTQDSLSSTDRTALLESIKSKLIAKPQLPVESATSEALDTSNSILESDPPVLVPPSNTTLCVSVPVSKDLIHIDNTIQSTEQSIQDSTGRGEMKK